VGVEPGEPSKAKHSTACLGNSSAELLILQNLCSKRCCAMSLSLLPTDNLYKFAALMGLTGLFALVFVLPNTIASRFQEKHFKALREQAAFEAQSKGLDDIIRTLNQIIEAQATPKASEDNLRLPLDYAQDEINGMMKELADRRMKAAILKSEIEVLVKEMQEIDKERQRLYIQLIVGGFVFAAMTIWGLLKWRKIQLLADERFEVELADLKKKH
jgi:hypothetical protein